MRHRERLDAILAEHELEAIWLAEPASFEWVTGGSNVIVDTDPVGVAAVGYDGDEFEVLTANNEVDRVREEDVPGEVSVHSFEWHEHSLAEAVADRSPMPAGADFPVPGLESIDVSAYRQPLTDEDIESYRALGEETAAGLQSVCRELTAETTEKAVAAALRTEFAERGIAAPVVLVAGGDRAQRHRHFTPTDTALGEYALVTMVTERGGQYASITRTVAFDPPAWLEERHDAAARVHSTTLAATREVGAEGGSAGDVFATIQSAYDAVGYPDEWRLHHQGGAAGYATREWVATPDGTNEVTLQMAYAWNPTVQGGKCEDTFFVTEDGFENLTSDGSWPTSSAEAIGYDIAIPQHDILDRSE